MWRACARRGWRRLALGLPTLFGLGRRGVFIPYRQADALLAPGDNAYPALASLFTEAMPAFRDHLRRIDSFGAELLAIGAAPPPAPRWRQDWFPRLDAAAAYAMVRHARPRRIVEIGAGHSTRFFAQAIADGDLTTELVAIDPAPRASLAALPVRLITRPVQAVEPALFTTLAEGDFLSIDSSHVLLAGSDVDVLINGVLPTLPAGVRVHFHDIFLPDGYPSAWAWRGYNEQSAVAALLQGGGYRLLWSSHWVATRAAEAIASGVTGRLPLVTGAVEASLWLVKQR